MDQDNVQMKMASSLNKIFREAKYACAEDLNDKVWNAVVAQNKKSARTKLGILVFVWLSSVASLIPMTILLVKHLSSSGFYEYFSLIFSNLGAILPSWKEFGVLLAESVPLLSLSISLILLFIFFITLQRIFRQLNIKSQLSI